MGAKHVAVLMGGFSSERQVSLWSGSACADELERVGYRVTRVDVDRTIASVLADLRPDVVFNALHGPYGEDGKIQGILEYLQIPYTHSGVLASALAMDKQQAKRVAASVGIPVAEAKVMDRLDFTSVHPMKPPYVVKPVNEGSSFGVVIVDEGQSHPPQVITVAGMEVRRPGHGRAVRLRPGTYVCGDGRRGAGRDGDPASGAQLLRLRFEVRERRFKTRLPREN